MDKAHEDWAKSREYYSKGHIPTALDGWNWRDRDLRSRIA